MTRPGAWGTLAAVARPPRVLAMAIALAALAAPGCAGPRDPILQGVREGDDRGGRLVDLTWAFDADTIYWPTEEGFVHEHGTAGIVEPEGPGDAGGYWYAAHRFHAAEHGGTHMDAPIHFGRGRRSAEAVPLAQLVGPGVVVDVRPACARDRDHAIGVAALESYEGEHGRIPEGALVLLRTGFGRHWPDRERYLGTARRGPEAVAELHFPGLHPEAARWLVARRVGAVGIDTASIDPGQSTDFVAHRVLAAAEVPVFENLARLEALPARGFGVVALPMKIRGGTGAPLRVVALLPEG